MATYLSRVTIDTLSPWIQGHETTASLLAWTSKTLTNAPIEQSKLRSALRAQFSSESAPSAHDILAADIPYLDASIEELVRVANIVPELVRETSCDTELLGHVIPKGATVVSSLYVGNKPFTSEIVPDEVRSENSRNNKGNFKSFWQSDMGEYHPERWLMDDGAFDAKALPRLAFSTGPRPCSGESPSSLVQCCKICIFSSQGHCNGELMRSF